jgi:long-chain acyl-CoA synthetase
MAGPQVMKGYWKKPEATEDAFRGGRFHTGDIGFLDQDGFVTLVDRKKDMILSGGFNVFPRNVEEAIYEHPAVAEVTVIGILGVKLTYGGRHRTNANAAAIWSRSGGKRTSRRHR